MFCLKRITANKARSLAKSKENNAYKEEIEYTEMVLSILYKDIKRRSKSGYHYTQYDDPLILPLINFDTIINTLEEDGFYCKYSKGAGCNPIPYIAVYW